MSTPVDPNTIAVSLLGTRSQDAFAQLYDRYSDALYGVVHKILRSDELAEEALQDSFVKIWKYAPTYDPAKGRAFTWMLQIARNTAIDYTRTTKFQNTKKTDTLNPLVYEDESLKTDPDVEDIGLRKVINSIDPKYRRLIELVYFQGYTHSDVQKELDIPLGTIKTRLRKAIMELRELLGKEGLTLVTLVLWICIFIATIL